MSHDRLCGPVTGSIGAVQGSGSQKPEHDGYERLLRFQDEDVRQPV